MTHLVERLRAERLWFENKIVSLEAEIERLLALKTPASAQLLNITKAALDDAEAEIERLRADIKDLKERQMAPIPWALERDLRAEIERLLSRVKELEDSLFRFAVGVRCI
jgi:hypothetical protein